MRFLSFSKNGVETVGVRVGNSVVDLGVAAPKLPRSLLGLILSGALEEAAGIAASASGKALLPIESIKYLSLIPEPPMMINLIWNPGDVSAAPGMSISVANRLCANREPMLVPKSHVSLDYGIELAVILKKGGRHISESAASDHIAGYTVFNGGTVRGVPAGQTVAVARNFDKTAPFGPELVTPEELPPLAANLQMTLKRHGIVVQTGTTSMFWSVAKAISLASSYMTVEAGTVITLGTLSGTVADRIVGLNDVDSRNAPIEYLRAGEILEAEIEGIGTLCNVIVNEA